MNSNSRTDPSSGEKGAASTSPPPPQQEWQGAISTTVTARSTAAWRAANVGQMMAERLNREGTLSEGFPCQKILL